MRTFPISAMSPPSSQIETTFANPTVQTKGNIPPNRYPFVLFPGVYGKNYGHRLSKYLGKWVDPQYLVSSMIKNHNCWKLYSTASQAGTHVDDWEPEPGFSSSSQPRFIYLCSPLVHLRWSLSLSLSPFLLRALHWRWASLSASITFLPWQLGPLSDPIMLSSKFANNGNGTVIAVQAIPHRNYEGEFNQRYNLPRTV